MKRQECCTLLALMLRLCASRVGDVVQKGVPQMLIKRGELALMATDKMLMSSPSPEAWSKSIDVIGRIIKVAQFSAAVQSMPQELYGKVLVKVDVCSPPSRLAAMYNR